MNLLSDREVAEAVAEAAQGEIYYPTEEPQTIEQFRMWLAHQIWILDWARRLSHNQLSATPTLQCGDDARLACEHAERLGVARTVVRPTDNVSTAELYAILDTLQRDAKAAGQPARAAEQRTATETTPAPAAAEGTATLPVLNETDKAAAKYIKDNPGAKGCNVAIAIGKCEEHVRSRIIPKLKKLGYYNSNGYRPPKRGKAKKA